MRVSRRRPPVDPITLQDLINAAQGEDGKPPADPAKAVAEYLAAHPDADVAALQAEAVQSFTEISAAGADSDDSLAAVEALADVIDGVKVEQERIDAAGEEKRAKLAALSERVKAATGSEAEGEDNADADATAEAEVVAEAEAVAVDAAGADANVDAAAAAETAVPEAVAASAAKPVRRVRLSQIERKPVTMPAENNVDTTPRATILASADVAGFAPGQGLSTRELADAANVKLQSLSASGSRNSASVARIHVPFDEELTATAVTIRTSSITPPTWAVSLAARLSQQAVGAHHRKRCTNSVGSSPMPTPAWSTCLR